MFSDFKRAFKRIDDLKNIKVIDNCPCRICEYKKEYHLKWDKIPNYWERPEIKECNSCTKYANYLMDVQEKLKWYEDNDNNLKVEE